MSEQEFKILVPTKLVGQLGVVPLSKDELEKYPDLVELHMAGVRAMSYRKVGEIL